MIKVPALRLLNSKGLPIELTPREKATCDYWQRQVNERFGNNLGYEINITTLTTISKKVSEQKFFQIPPADYMPVVVGAAPFASNLTVYRSFAIADEFETGFIDNGGQNSRLATADAAVDALNIPIFNWAKTIGWTIFELEQAAKSGNWDLVSSKEVSRKTNWDLGVQRIAFLGARGLNGTNGQCVGLLNQSGITTNTTTIPQNISAMSTTELKTFTQVVVENYRANCNRTAWPTHFVIPESDYNGLASQASPDFPIKSTLQLLEESFQIITRNKGFKILPCAYGDAAYNNLSTQIYALLNYDEKSLVMNVPLDYTNTLANSLDNFGFQNTGYGQISGVLVLRPLELLYFTHS